MKKLIAILLTVVMVMSLCAVAVSADEVTEISLWTYPIGKWVDEATVSALLDDFHAAHPEIKVNVEYLDYANGDDKVNTAIEGNQAPDIIMEGPERLIANWGAKGLMVDLADCIPAGTYEAVVSSCTSANGEVYEMPMCMVAHCMAINRDVFEEAGALQYLNEETHTWNSVEDFFKAVQAVYDAGYEYVGCIYCGGQGGDQGTRALVTNIAGATAYSNDELTEYVYATEANAGALAKLHAQDGIIFDPSIAATEEIQNFVNGTFQMAFCWNISQEKNNADALGFDVLPMAFPCDVTPVLQGGIWGFGVFNNGDEARIEAAKTFVKFMSEDDAQYTKAVEATNFAPVRALDGVYAGDELFTEYSVMNPMMGVYYQITKGWAIARTEWWNMLQRVMDTDGSVEAILAEMTVAQDAANAAAAG
ncbi:MAG: extracellular solute-binding protein [Candidatus Faecousia sp.]|nr:extracellular solute-binding protein [Bacillota bacterium]MDY4755340.1 extracellular solute-binding protein [Candidatus Faecousia sp.]MDY6159537.1 extracellular solute-binding protein [Candidatus Faecousia sp.]